MSSQQRLTIGTETLGLVLDAAGNAHVPVNLRGGPGIGKTAVLTALAHARQRHLEIVISSVREPSDFAGLPLVSDGEVTSLAPPRWAKAIAEAGEGLIFFDEVNTATPAVQAALLRVITEGWVGDLTLPDDTWYVAAMNPVEIAAGGWDLAPPLANRFLHLPVAADAELWAEGMLSNWAAASEPRLSIDPPDEQRAVVMARITAFVRTQPEFLYKLPDDPQEASGAWPSPRSWDYLSRVLPRIPEDADQAILAVCTGLVGDRAATEFLTFVEQYDLPSPTELLADPALLNWTDERGDRILNALQSVVGLISLTKSAEQFGQALVLIRAALDAERDDIAAAVIRPLMSAKPDGATVELTLMARFTPLLARAGKVG